MNTKVTGIKLYVLILFLFLLTGKSYSQYDSLAIVILDSMSREIANLETCSFKVVNQYDVQGNEYGMISHTETGAVFLKGPDKFFIDKKGDKGYKKIYYDGKKITIFMPDTKEYASAPAPPTIMETIDSISSYYGIEFPAADFFYPDFVYDILANSANLIYLGPTSLNGKECYHIAGVQNDMTYQIWISSEGNYLPYKMAIIYTNKPGNPRYEAILYDWNLNKEMNDSMFDFTASDDLNQIKILKKINN